MLTKEKCEEALNGLWFGKLNGYHTLKQLINEHFASSENRVETRDNPPLKFEELEVYHWYWDEQLHEYFYVTCINKEFETISTDWEVSDAIYDIKYFEENRFYRYEVKE